MSDEELSVVIEPEEEAPPITPEIVKEAAPKIEKTPIETVAEPAVDDLKAQLEELRASREAAQSRARALEAEVQKANARASDSDLATITTGIEQAQAEIDQAKRDIKLAKDSGDGDAEVDAIDRMTTAKATFLRLDESKADAESRKKAPQPSHDPIEAYVANRTPQTANWLRAHPEFITDARKNAKLTAAHYDAEGDGLRPDTPEYFAHVEKYLKIGSVANEAEDIKPVAKPVPRRQPSAPVAPGAATANGGTAPSNEVRLTAGEARAATDGTHTWNWDDPKGKFKKGDVIGHQEMARRKLAMTKQGRYDRSFTES